MGWTPGPGATGGADTYTGDGTDEVVDGLGGNDTLNGAGGADTLTGGLGADIVNGDAGNDIIVVNEADATGVADQYNGGADTDTLRVIGTSGGQQNFDFWLPSFSSIERIEFASVTGAETRLNFQVNDFGAGISLNVAIVGSALTDTIFIRNVDDNVAVTFNASGFTFTNWSDSDFVAFTLGNGADHVTGTSMNDEMNGFAGADNLVGGAGNDSLDGGDDNDFLDGGAGNDNFFGGNGADTLYGRAGNDYLNAGTGADTMYGGDGDDTYVVDNVGDVAIENGPTGGLNDAIDASISYTLGAGFEQLYLFGPDVINGTGNELNNYINGSDLTNILTAKAGMDTVYGQGGDDTIYGGDGNDNEYGQDGADFLDGGNNDDVLYGGNNDDTLYGRAGNDSLDGQAGNDSMYGGAGDDNYYVDSTGDVVAESANAGIDTVTSYASSYSLGAYIENLYLTDAGGTPITGVGNILANTIIGNTLANALSGLGGNDTISAHAGNDTVNGGDGNDTLSGDDGDDLLDGGNNDDGLHGGNGNDTLYGRSGNDQLYGDDDNDTVYGGDGDDYNSGGNGNDLIDAGNGNDNSSGDDGADVIYGRNGQDRIDGGLGVDALWGGNDADTFVFSTALGGGNIDTIGDFSVVDDTIELRHVIFTAAGNVGVLDAGAFVTGSAAADADDRIIYDSTTGALYYDDDGTGGDAAVQFATLSTGLSLTHDDFFIG